MTKEEALKEARACAADLIEDGGCLQNVLSGDPEPSDFYLSHGNALAVQLAVENLRKCWPVLTGQEWPAEIGTRA